MDMLNRCFIGIRPSDQMKATVNELQGALKHKTGSEVLRFIPANELLITIVTLGELGLATIKRFQELLPGVICPYPKMRIGFEAFSGHPSNLQPRFVNISLSGGQPLIDIYSKLEPQVRTMVPSYEARPFHPHLNIGRLRTESEANRTAVGRAMRMIPVPPGIEMEVQQIELLRSVVSPTGPSFETIEGYALQ